MRRQNKYYVTGLYDMLLHTKLQALYPNIILTRKTKSYRYEEGNKLAIGYVSWYKGGPSKLDIQVTSKSYPFTGLGCFPLLQVSVEKKLVDHAP